MSILVLWGLALVVAHLSPDLDLHVVDAVRNATGHRFAGNGGIWAPLYYGLPYLIYAMALGAVTVLAVGVFGWRPAIRYRRAVLVILGTLLVYLIVVEALLKNHWGRARPRDIAEFGGLASYTPPLQPSDQCLSNCAFVSGHVAAAFTLVALALAVPQRWRLPAIAAALTLGGLTGVMRVLQGAHFPFDVVFAGLIVGTAAFLLDRYLPRSASSRKA